MTHAIGPMSQVTVMGRKVRRMKRTIIIEEAMNHMTPTRNPVMVSHGKYQYGCTYPSSFNLSDSKY